MRNACHLGALSDAVPSAWPVLPLTFRLANSSPLGLRWDVISYGKFSLCFLPWHPVWFGSFDVWVPFSTSATVCPPLAQNLECSGHGSRLWRGNGGGRLPPLDHDRNQRTVLRGRTRVLWDLNLWHFRGPSLRKIQNYEKKKLGIESETLFREKKWHQIRKRLKWKNITNITKYQKIV